LPKAAPLSVGFLGTVEEVDGKLDVHARGQTSARGGREEVHENAEEVARGFYLSCKETDSSLIY